MVRYQYSKEFEEYFESIKNFISNLILTNRNEFKIIELTKYASLPNEYITDFPNNQYFTDTISICANEIFSDLLSYTINKIESILSNDFSENKECLFKYKQSVYYTKKSIEERRTIIQKINGQLKGKIIANLSSDIITFLQQHFNDKTINILRVFLKNKSHNITFIENDSEPKKIDFLPIKLINLSIHTSIHYDKNIYSLTSNQLKNINETFQISILASDQYLTEAHYGSDVIGLVIGEYLFFYDLYPLLKEKIICDQNIKYSYLKEDILLADTKASHTSEKINLFKSLVADENMLGILIKLKENIYISEEDFASCQEGNANQFFHLAYLIETEYLKHNQFFIPFINENATSLFGVHNNSNARDDKGNAIKGLKTWIDTNGIEQNLTSKETKTIAKKVMHLLPDIAFYYREKFFEDLLKDILDEIKSENPHINLNIIENKKFYVNKNSLITNPLNPEASYVHNQEFDFIVNYKNSHDQLMTIIIETKTKLSKFIIQDQADKVEKYIKNDDLGIFNKYFLIGFNIDDNVYSAMAYFIENLSIDENLSGLAFKYPLPATKQDLYCIASHDKNQLKTNLLALFNL